MKNLLNLSVAACGLFVFASCGSQPELVEKRPEPRYLDSLVGRVSTLEKDSGIVLIRTFGSFKSNDGDVFLTRGKGGSAGNIKLSGQANKFFLAAEYLSGQVAEGDSVYWRRLNPDAKDDVVEKVATVKLNTPSQQQVVQQVVPTVIEKPKTSEVTLVQPDYKPANSTNFFKKELANSKIDSKPVSKPKAGFGKKEVKATILKKQPAKLDPNEEALRLPVQ